MHVKKNQALAAIPLFGDTNTAQSRSSLIEKCGWPTGRKLKMHKQSFPAPHQNDERMEVNLSWIRSSSSILIMHTLLKQFASRKKCCITSRKKEMLNKRSSLSECLKRKWIIIICFYHNHAACKRKITKRRKRQKKIALLRYLIFSLIMIKYNTEVAILKVTCYYFHMAKRLKAAIIRGFHLTRPKVLRGSRHYRHKDKAQPTA